MTPDEFRIATRRCGLYKMTDIGRALGVSARHVANYFKNRNQIPEHVVVNLSLRLELIKLTNLVGSLGARCQALTEEIDRRTRRADVK